MPKDKDKVLLKDISEHLNISQNTVSLALRGKPGVKQSTREKILETANALGYIRSDNPNVVLLVTTLSNSNDAYFYSHLQRVIEEELNKQAYKSVAAHCLDEQQGSTEQIFALSSHVNPKGIFVIGEINAAVCRKLYETNLPLVCVGSYSSEVPAVSIIEDNFGGLSAIMRHLVEQGYTSFGFIGNTKVHVSFWERWIAFAGFLCEFHLKYDERCCLSQIPLPDLYDPDLLAARLKKIPALPQLFICCNDKIAAATVKALHNLGLSVPEDIAVVGYDNSEIAHMTIPTLTTVDSLRELQGIVAVETLLNKIANPSPSRPMKIILPAEIVEGGSTRRIF